MPNQLMINIGLVLVTVIVTLLVGDDPYKRNKLTFMPYHIVRDKQYFRFISSGFIHANYPHLLFNMIALYSIGTHVEEEFGMLLYLGFYLVALVVSGIPTFIKHKDNPAYSALGASGAVSAVVLAFILMDPTRELYIMFIPFGIPGYILAVGYMAYSYIMSKKNIDNIGHEAHLTGGLFGIAFTVVRDPGVVSDFVTAISNHSLF